MRAHHNAGQFRRLASFMLACILGVAGFVGLASVPAEAAMAVSSQRVLVNQFDGTIVTTRSDGSDVQLVAPSSFNGGYWPADSDWSPTRNEVAVIARGTTQMDGVFLTEPGSGKFTQIMDSQALSANQNIWINLVDIAWSPDGNWLSLYGTFQRPNYPDAHVAIMRRDGSGLRLFSGLETNDLQYVYGDGTTSWSPDGATLAIPSMTPHDGSTGDGSLRDIAFVNVATGIMTIRRAPFVYGSVTWYGPNELALGTQSGIRLLNISSWTDRLVTPPAAGDVFRYGEVSPDLYQIVSVSGFDQFLHVAAPNGDLGELPLGEYSPTMQFHAFSASWVPLSATPAPTPTTTPSNPAPSVPVTKKALRTVVMGDSFTSGEGVPEFESKTDISRGAKKNLCHRSYGAYANLLHNSHDIILDKFVACSGATTANILSTAQYAGQNPQLWALNKNTQQVILTIGGNDVNFAPLATDCVTIGCLVNYDQSNSALLGLAKITLPQTYAAIRARAPKAKVYVLGYPQVATDPANANYATCNDFRFIKSRMSAAEAKLMRDFVDRLNNTIKSVAEQNHFQYVDPSSEFSGHGLCGSDPYFNPVNLKDRAYSLHPNAKGQEAYAAAIRRAMK